jgi:hypothetical protein
MHEYPTTDPAYLYLELACLFPSVSGPNDAFTPPTWLLQNARRIASTPVPAPRKPNVIFDTTETAVRHNTKIIEDLGYDFDQFMAENSDTTIGYNSKFQLLSQTETLFGQHPGFGFFRTFAELGMAYHFSDTIREVDRWAKLERVLRRGNHKSAEADLLTVSQILGKDVTHGFSLPLSPSIIQHISDAEVQPCGLAQQFGLQANGSRVAKSRLTQDLSFWTIGANKLSTPASTSPGTRR